MHIHNSELFQSYLGQNNSTEQDIAEMQNTKNNMLTLIGNIAFVGRYFWAAALLLGFAGLLFTERGSIIWNISMILTPAGVAGISAMIYAFIRDDVASQPAVLDKPRVSITEYMSLVDRLSRLLDTDRSVLEGLTIEELQEVSSKELRKQASEIKETQVLGGQSHVGRYAFREAHTTMYKLGLVSAHWDRYFQQSA